MRPKKTVDKADFCSAGRYVAKDLFEGRRVPLRTKALLGDGYLHGGCSTVRGRSVAESFPNANWNQDQSVVRPVDKPLSATGGVLGRTGNLAQRCAIIEVAGMAGLHFAGTARRFDGEEACLAPVNNKKYRERVVLVIRCEAPQSGLGMREIARQVVPPPYGALNPAGSSGWKMCHAYA